MASRLSDSRETPGVSLNFDDAGHEYLSRRLERRTSTLPLSEDPDHEASTLSTNTKHSSADKIGAVWPKIHM